MIYYNSNTINDWNFGDDNIIKVYKHGAVCYYKITSGDTPTPVQEPCFAVVDDITQYQDTEFEDVYDKATEKWYKLNNLNQYEEYGVYGSGRTSCESSASRLPQGYTEVEYVENTSTAYIDTGAYLNTSNFEVGYTFWGNRAQWGYVHQNVGSGAWITTANDYAYMGRFDSSYRVAIGSYFTSDENTIVYTQSGVTVNGTSISKNLNLSGTDNLNASPLLFFVWYDFYRAGVEHSFNSKVKSFYLKNNGILVRDFVPAKRDSDDKYGMYDIVNDVFYVSPNNVDFSGGEPVAPTDCVTTYEGKLTIDDGYEYQYSGGSWVNVGEVTGSTATLPNIPFVLNYNAKNYDAATHSIPMTSGQLNDTDAVAYNNPNNIVDHSADGYITVSNSSMRIRKQGQDISLFNRSSNSTSSDLTIVCKAKTTSGENIITNRDGSYNWMYRLKISGQLRFHGRSETGSIAWNTSNPDIMSVRTYYSSGTKLVYNNWTQNTSTSPTSFTYGSTNNDSGTAGALFVGYGWNSTNEQWSGDFYWVYMAQANLTDAQIQEVIDYNEGGGGEPEYPIYYDEIQDPPDNLVFSSMAEAEAYECPWVGMHATIDGDKYVFSGDSQSGYEWVYNPSRLPVGYTEVEYVERNSAHKGYLPLGEYFQANTRIQIDFQMTQAKGNAIIGDYGSNRKSDWRVFLNYDSQVNNWLVYDFINSRNYYNTGDWSKRFNIEIGNYYIKDLNTGTYLVNATRKTSFIRPNQMYLFHIEGSQSTNNIDYGYIYSVKIYQNNELVRDFVPCIRDNDSKVGMYDLVNDVFYYPPNNGTLVAGDPV